VTARNEHGINGVDEANCTLVIFVVALVDAVADVDLFFFVLDFKRLFLNKSGGLN
jgi:hypothetical protein